MQKPAFPMLPRDYHWATRGFYVVAHKSVGTMITDSEFGPGCTPGDIITPERDKHQSGKASRPRSEDSTFTVFLHFFHFKRLHQLRHRLPVPPPKKETRGRKGNAAVCSMYPQTEKHTGILRSVKTRKSV